MEEFGGSPTDSSVIHLDPPENLPSTSSAMPNGASCKRAAELDDAFPDAKKKKSVEEQASTSKGRNSYMKEKLAEEKKKSKDGVKVAELRAHREMILDKLSILENREMADDDRREEKLLIKEEKLREALFRINETLDSNESMPKKVTEEVVINLHPWNDLQQPVINFITERIYSPKFRDESRYMMTEDLREIMDRVKRMNPMAVLPMDRHYQEKLIVKINGEINERMRSVRGAELKEQLEEYPGYCEEQERALDGVVMQTEGDLLDRLGPNGLSERLTSTIRVNWDEAGEETTSEDGIIIDDDADQLKMGDEDEVVSMSASHVTGEEEEDEDDIQLMQIEGLVMPLPMQLKVVKEEPKDEGRKKIEVVTTMEEEPTRTMDEVEGRGESSQSGGSKEGEEMRMEGGTSTNSPAIGGAAEINDLPSVQAPMKKESLASSSDVQIRTPPVVVNLVETVVLDDDDDEEIEREEGKREMKMEVKKEEGDQKMKEDERMEGEKKDEKTALGGDGDGPHPPKAVKRTPEEAWRLRLMEINQWVVEGMKIMEDGQVEKHFDVRWTVTTPNPIEQCEVEEIDYQELEEKTEEKDIDDDDDDEAESDVQCLHDDFEMDSVSHSGLPSARPPPPIPVPSFTLPPSGGGGGPINESYRTPHHTTHPTMPIHESQAFFLRQQEAMLQFRRYQQLQMLQQGAAPILAAATQPAAARHFEEQPRVIQRGSSDVVELIEID